MSRLSVSSVTKVPQAAPKGPPGTLDVYFKGTNVLVDPSFDQFVQMTGGWDYRSRSTTVTNDYALPYLDVSCPNYLKYSDGICIESSLPTWCQTSGPYEAFGLGTDQAWKVSLVEPRSGTYHAAWWSWSNGDIPPGELCPINPYLSAPFSARVEPGDSVTFSYWVKTGSGYGVLTPSEAFATVRFYNASFSLLRADVSTPVVTGTTYTQISSNTVSAPAGAKYVRCCAGFINVPGNSVAYVDDAALAVL